jgi:hypothetical protein
VRTSNLTYTFTVVSCDVKFGLSIRKERLRIWCLRVIFVSEIEEVTGEWRKLHARSVVICILYKIIIRSSKGKLDELKV